MGILSVLTSSTFSIQADGESSTLMKVVETVRDNVWGIPLIVLIMGAGLLLTVRTGGLQFRRLGKALKYMWFNEEGGEGEVSSFGALCTALAATIGTGNIVGVATAVMAGGPGALFWMLVAAAVGMATKYSEGILAVKYRQFDKKTGKALGGPFYYIEKGMGERFAGKNWRWLGNLFAIFGAFAALMGTGTFAQISGISKAADTFFDPNKTNIAFSIGDQSYSWSTVITAIVVALFVGLVIIGGIKRIAAVTTYIVPFMAVLYITVCLIILIYNGDKVGGAIALVVKSAFGHGYSPVIAGGIGAVIRASIQNGVARGIFSNEAGLGTAPIAAAAAKTNEPVRQGLVSMTGTFVDTIIVCTMTGLMLVITGAYKQSALEGVDVTIYGFGEGLPWTHAFASFVLLICLAMFAFTTILGWDYYGESCLAYLTRGNAKVIKTYKVLYILAVLIGPFVTLNFIWTFADIFNGLMAAPNLIALIALSGIIKRETKDYFTRLDAGQIDEGFNKKKK